MAAPVVPRYTVAPPEPDLPAPYSLIQSATTLEDVPVHQLTGVEYEAVCSTRVDGYPMRCEPGTSDLEHTKTPHDTTSVTTGTPFGLYAADSCVLGRDENRARQQLRQRFTAGESAAVEHLVETGGMANWPNLQHGPHVDVLDSPDGGADLRDAFGQLEQWIAETRGSPGMIHAPRVAGPHVFKDSGAKASGGRAKTIMGSTIVFGTGYSGHAPDGETTGDTVWLYATPQVTIRRSERIEPATWGTGAFDMSTNSGFLLVERIYVVDWPCGVAAIETDLTKPGTSSSSRRTGARS